MKAIPDQSRSPGKSKRKLEPVRVKASSFSNDNHLPPMAVDGSTWTRWNSSWGETPQWLEIDLGRTLTVRSVGIVWSHWGKASEYTVSVSCDGVAWERVTRVSGRSELPLFETSAFPAGRRGRFLRIDCLKRVRKEYGFSIVHVLVNGKKLVARPLPVASLARKAPFRDRKLSPERRARDLVSRLSFDELLDLTGGYASFHIHPLDRFGLPAIAFTDASAGVRFTEDAGLDKSVSFPATVALAATWNPNLAAAYGKSVGEECRAYGVHALLGPGVNLYRTATNGRNFEYLGEDPFLASRLAVSYIRAMQATGVMACAKHFACNNNEWIRHDIDVEVDDRAMQEIYLPAFRAVIQEAGVMAVMTAYNYWRGEKASQNRELIEGVLRGELGFRNLVMSDWGAVWDGAKVLASGQDLVMPGNEMVRKYAAENPDKRPEIKTRLKRMAGSILRAVFAMGFYDRPQARPEFLRRFRKHEQVALDVARQAMTLLKNRSALPLKAGKMRTVLLTGPAAASTPHGGDGSGRVLGYNQIGYAEGLRQRLGNRLKVDLAPGDRDLEKADLVIVCPFAHEREDRDRWFELAADQESLIRRAARLNPNTVVVLTQGGGIRMSGWADSVNAILFAYYGGQRGGTALADVLTGRANPGGKLPFSIEQEFADSPAAEYLPDFILKERDPRFLADSEETKALLKERGIALPHPLPYREGIYVGYRWYDSRNIEPLFPFGHGLSYTSFEYSELKLTRRTVGKECVVEVSLTVRNTGKRAGHETVQAYVSDVACSVDRPAKELKGFAKVFLKPGEKTCVRLTLDRGAFAFWHPSARRWTVEPGTFRVLIGASSRDIRLSGEIDYPRS